MSHALRKLGTRIATLALTATALLSTGCADNDSSIFVVGVSRFDPENDCTATASGVDTELVTSGALDRQITSGGFGGPILVANQLVRRADADQLKVETSRVHVYEVEVQVFDFEGGLLGEYVQPVSGFIDAAQGGEPSVGYTFATLVDPASAGAAVGTTVISRIIVRGRSLGGVEVETAPWDYPVDICDGCLGCIVPNDCDDDLAVTCTPGVNASIDCRQHPNQALNPCP